MGRSVSPFIDVRAWQQILVGSVKSPGVIARGGVHGFERETEWDIKKGKGVKGGTLTLMQRPPAKGAIDFLIWNDAIFQEWDSFRDVLNYDPDKEPAQAISIFHPALACVDVDAVVVKNISPPREIKPGLYQITVSMIEYAPPPPVDATSTPTTATTTADPDIPGDPPDPAFQAEQDTMQSLWQQAGFSQ